MCGIAGIISNTPQILNYEIKAMTNIIRHRGPDDEGFLLVNPNHEKIFSGDETPSNNTPGISYYPTENIDSAKDEYNFAFGYRRLSIIDLSAFGHQPMSYNKSNLWIIYNGEVYNYLEIKEELQNDGYSFISKTDTEVILAAYQKWGTECVHHFNGMWAFAIYDKEKQIIFCSRDRFGVKPFYYTQIGDKFCFASEIKQFSIINGWLPKVNIEIMYDYLVYGLTDHTKDTFFTNIFQLQGGHSLIYQINKKTFQINKWYFLDKIKEQKNSSFEKNKNDFIELFNNSIKLRLRSDVKVGSCLSGGLDSSSIVCVLNNLLRVNQTNEIQETISSCFIDKRFDEQEFIDEVVRNTQVKAHKVFPEFNNLFEDFDKIIWHQDEPFASSSIYAQWNVFKEAKKNNLTVMLDGQGGDEQLAGYSDFYIPYYVYLIKKLKWKKLYSELKSFSSLYKKKYSFLNIIKYIIILNTPEFLRKKFRQLFKISKPAWLLLPEKDHSFYFSSIRKSSISQLTSSSVPRLLRYEDRNSMAFSIESRVPFLDYKFVEHNISLKPEYLINKSKTKYILREAFNQLLPKKIINRYDKMGFCTPEEIWFKQNSEIIKKEIIEASITLNKYINQSDLIKQFNADLLNDKIKIGSIYWRLICLNRWFKIFNLSV
jgi:asparagine synthase (glutamine-hydrolysing)